MDPTSEIPPIIQNDSEELQQILQHKIPSEGLAVITHIEQNQVDNVSTNTLEPTILSPENIESDVTTNEELGLQNVVRTTENVSDLSTDVADIVPYSQEQGEEKKDESTSERTFGDDNTFDETAVIENETNSDTEISESVTQNTSDCFSKNEESRKEVSDVQHSDEQGTTEQDNFEESMDTSNIANEDLPVEDINSPENHEDEMNAPKIDDDKKLDESQDVCMSEPTAAVCGELSNATISSLTDAVNDKEDVDASETDKPDDDKMETDDINIIPESVESSENVEEKDKENEHTSFHTDPNKEKDVTDLEESVPEESAPEKSSNNEEKDLIEPEESTEVSGSEKITIDKDNLEKDPGDKVTKDNEGNELKEADMLDTSSVEQPEAVVSNEKEINETETNESSKTNDPVVEKEPNESIVNEIQPVIENEDKISTSDSLLTNDKPEDKDKNTTFVQVDLEKETEADNDKEDGNNELEIDPIAGEFDAANDDPDLEQDKEEGADEELCIIPDTDRVLSQAEKDAASALPPLKDITSAANQDGSTALDGSSVEGKYIIHKYDLEEIQSCIQCCLQRKVKFQFNKDTVKKYLCDDKCLDEYKQKNPDKVVMSGEREIRVKNLTGYKEQSNVSFVRKCASCSKKTDNPEVNLAWEIMDFCNETCLSKYQKEIGSVCASCSSEVRANSLGKYCVRFGNDIRQFCTSHCLEEYKKGLKVCSYCQQDMSSGTEGFLAPIGGKGQFKDFCSQNCMEKYDVMTNDRAPKVPEGTSCCVCKTEKPITIEYILDDKPNYFCGDPCFVAFSFVNNITAGKCAMCRRNFSRTVLEKHTMYYDNIQFSFCSNSCQNIYIIAHRKIVPCSWCKVKKYNFDMIRRYSKNADILNMCSVNCFNLYQVSVNAVTSKKISCDMCTKSLQPMYHLTMSDATIRNFCSYSCVMTFQNQFAKMPISMNNTGQGKVIPTGTPKRSKRVATEDNDAGLPVISSVQSLAANSPATSNGTATPVPVPPPPLNVRSTRSKSNASNNTTPVSNSVPISLPDISNIQIPTQTVVKQQLIVQPRSIPEQRNVMTMTRPRCFNKGVNTTLETAEKGIQTEKREKDKILIPVPVPIYVPAPLHMFSNVTFMPVPVPIPIPIPVFIPTTRNSANGIMKEIKKIQVKIPSDPYEAELLMMAEMVADDKKEENTDSDTDMEDNGAGADESHFSPEPVDASNTFGDDMLQMALKMATELDEPAVDLEGALTANTITAPQQEVGGTEESVSEQPIHLMERQSMRGRKRGMRGGRTHTPSKRGRRMPNQTDVPIMQPPEPAPMTEPIEKPDANMCLKYTFGVNAWKQWVTTKNSELEKSSRHVKLFKTEILQLTADELNYSLCLFVKEVRKPNGAEYAPDTIYYLCLGIQQYLFENGRIDNIFCDPYYEKFTDCLDEVARKFSVLYNDSHYIVTRVEEEHLWESKQLGAHSPHVLLSTLMFFNTKHFNLTTVDEHMQLSFSHIMKHWKRNPNQPGASKIPGSRNVLLRFYPPQSAIQNNARKKKVYEQQENEENPLRCPVKLYEFYLSKCPESVKTRNDVFYLQPERSCVPDSPVWYSTMPLPRESLEKMLHRVKMVKEINVALLTS